MWRIQRYHITIKHLWDFPLETHHVTVRKESKPRSFANRVNCKHSNAVNARRFQDEGILVRQTDLQNSAGLPVSSSMICVAFADSVIGGVT